MSATDTPDIAEVLLWVNDRRAEMGYEPLSALRKGTPINACGCPIAKSLQEPGGPLVSVCSSSVGYGDVGDPNYLNWWTTQAVREFVHAFDRNRFPELIETP